MPSRRSTARNASERIENAKTQVAKEIIVTVFGSSRPREGDADYEEARVLGRALAKHGFAVCSGGLAGVVETGSPGGEEAGVENDGVGGGIFSMAEGFKRQCC